MKRLPWQNKAFLIIISLLAAIGMKYCISSGENTLVYSNSVLAFFVWGGWLLALMKITAGEHWGEMKDFLNAGFGFLLLFTGSLIAGAKLESSGNVDFAEWQIYAAAVVTALAAAPFFAAAVYYLRGNKSAGKEEAGENGRKYFLGVWALFFLAYLPTFLASFPGFFIYDAEQEVYMVFTGKYSAHHPIMHVLLLGWVLRIVYGLTKSYNAGIAVYTLLQMLLVSGCFAYVMSWLRRIKVRRWIRIAGIVFLALFPTVSMFVCCSTKDVLFSAGVLLVTTMLCRIAREGDGFWERRGNKAGFVLSVLMVLFFRNNGIYAMALTLLLFAAVYRRSWRKWLTTVLSAILIFGAVTGGMKVILRYSETEIAEMLCVPMQQLARVYNYEQDSFSEEERETMFELIPQMVLEQYNPKLADDIKYNFLEDNFKSDPGKYFSLWLRKGLEYPGVYVNSFLENTYDYWYPDTVLDGYTGKRVIEGVYYGESSYFAFETEMPGTRRHLLPWLERFYERLSFEIYQHKLPVVSMLFSMGFWHWGYAFLACYLLVTKKRRLALSLSLMGALYLTVLLGPIALVRYVLYFYFAVPLLLAALFDTETLAGGETAEPDKINSSIA